MACNSKTLFIKIASAITAIFLFIPFTSVKAETPAADVLQQAGFIFLQVKIPSPTCLGGGNANILCCQDEMAQNYVNEKNATLPDKQKITCPDGSIAAVKNAPAFVASFFQFGIIFIAIVMIGVLVVAGLLYVTSGGNPAQAGKALDYVKRAATSLVVLIFSAVILNQIGPRFTTLGLTGMDVVKHKLICMENKDEPKCTAAGCLWNSLTKACNDFGAAACADFSSDTACNKLTGKCLWDTTLNTCLTVRVGDKSCSVATQPTPCLKEAGCIWDSGCLAKDLNNTTAVTQCDAFSNPADCSANTLCAWKTGACVLEKAAKGRNCSDFNSGNCPLVSCYIFHEAGLTSCRATVKPGAKCVEGTGDGESGSNCDSMSFCNPTTKICQAKLGEGESCEAYGVNANQVCISGDCTARIGENTCTAP